MTVGSEIQLYFGGITVDGSLNILMLAAYLLMIVIEVIAVNQDVMEGFDNWELLVVRFKNRGAMFGYLTGQMAVSACFLTVSNYVLYLFLLQRGPCVQDIVIVLYELLLIWMLDYIYFLLLCIWKNSAVYVIAVILFLLPVLYVGFLYAAGTGFWETGKYYILLRSIYNYTQPMQMEYTDMGYVYQTVVFDLKGQNEWVLLMENAMFLALLIKLDSVIFCRR